MPGVLATTLELTDDERLLAAEAIVRGYCGWHIAPVRTVSIVVPAHESQVVLLPSLRVTDLRVLDGLGQPMSSDLWLLDGCGIVRRNFPFWPWASSSTGLRGALTFTFDSGFATVPPDVTAVVVGVALRSKSNPTGLSSSTSGPFSSSYPGDLFGLERGILDRYKLPARP